MQRFRPRLTAPWPEGWLVKEQITLLAPDGQSNVITSSEPLEPSIDTQEYAKRQADVLQKEFLGYREIWFEPVETVDGRAAYARCFAWTPQDREPVTQIQLYYAEGGRGYTTTATALSTAFPRLELQLRQLVEGMTIER